ncbi:MAG: Flp pilus assembly complex ATPase component TadA [Candidatus Marinimicrobia bacterium]|nr:Flp pilus assembly complex ATPase component TadA [Candidatus Neomarinimicrobiota bacterium]MCF7880571.1 Flp pilus assembly complex ATPase component TadA [Candidatus Neomarinimicrobiota bacterium]
MNFRFSKQPEIDDSPSLDFPKSRGTDVRVPSTEKPRHLGRILLRRGIITESQLQTALSVQERESGDSQRSLGLILNNDLGVDRHEVMSEIARIYAFRIVGQRGESFPEEQIEFIKGILEDLDKDTVSRMVHHKVIPYEMNRNALVFAAADPTAPGISPIISDLNFKQYEIAYCRLEVLNHLIEQVYEEKNEYLDLLDDMEFTDAEVAEQTNQIDEEELDAEINRSMLNSLVEGMLLESVRRGVSDIHVLPKEGNVTEVHFRIDGKLQLWHRQEGVKPEAISAVIKDKTRNVDRFERDSSQDGFIQRVVDNHQIRYRVSILPIVGQEFSRKLESVVIRVLDDRKVITDLNKLGLQEQAHSDFLKAITKPSGIVIITGPTGSGKSTTLVAAISHIIDPSINVLTVEEPVEYLIRGARQLKLGDHMTFDQSLRGILRHDPDVVLVGEIRDLKTAEISIKLANTGHLTFSTLHTNDAPSAISRLYKMGVEPFLIANAVNLVMAQRLVRKLCDHCKTPIEDMHPDVPLNLGFTEEEVLETTFYKPVGCDKCHNGYKGRTAIMEALSFTKGIRNAILNAGEQIDEERIKSMAIGNGMLTLRASGRERVKEGVTSLEEVAAITVED